VSGQASSECALVGDHQLADHVCLPVCRGDEVKPFGVIAENGPAPLDDRFRVKRELLRLHGLLMRWIVVR